MNSPYNTIKLLVFFVFLSNMTLAQLNTRFENFVYTSSESMQFRMINACRSIMPESIPNLYFINIARLSVQPGSFCLNPGSIEGYYFDYMIQKASRENKLNTFIYDKNKLLFSDVLNGITDFNRAGSFISGKMDNPNSYKIFTIRSIDFAQNYFVPSQLSSKYKFTYRFNNFLNSNAAQKSIMHQFFNENYDMFSSGNFIYWDNYGNAKDNNFSRSGYFSVNDKTWIYMDTLVDYNKAYNYYLLLWLMEVIYEFSINK